ncbi:MAG: hypothetical protein GQ579_07140 [Bacteroidales bacterium]|nr:hypothetical protein [Bacteroidales bacterium]
MSTIFKTICLTILICTIPEISCTASDLENGPYKVGFESYKTYDETRLYLLGEDTISRPLLIHFWYPSQEKIEGQALNFKHYIDLIAQREDYNRSTSEIDENSFNYVNAYSDFAKRGFGLDTSVHTHQILDTPVSARSGISLQKIGPEFPLLIYAPSNSKSSVQNHMICEYLASHGFMIVSVASAGPNSIQRAYIAESTMAQVIDMEHILKYCEDSLNIEYTNLGVFGFSSGGLATTIFQMRNESVDAVLSMDGGQEYGAYPGLYKMEDFNLEKTNVPYCSVVNNYENFSIYPVYNSVLTSEKYMFQMPYLDHNGFISHWRFFESCSPGSIKSPIGISYDYMSECALGFFSKYLKPAPSLSDSNFFSGLDKEYIRAVSQDYSCITTLCNALLDNNLDSAARLVDDHKAELFAEETQINILARMFIDSKIDLAIWLYINNVKNHPDSWQAHYDLGYAYKEKGETLLSKNELLKAKELNPENTDITNLLNEINQLD